MSIAPEHADDPPPIAAMLGTVDAEGRYSTSMWSDPVTENPDPGATELWELYNTTADAHPMHIHEVLFQVVNREPINVDEESRKSPPPAPPGHPNPAKPDGKTP